MAFFAPLAQRNEMALQALDRVTERPGGGFFGGAIDRRIIGGGMRTSPVSDMLNERWASTGPRAFGGLFGHSVDG